MTSRLNATKKRERNIKNKRHKNDGRKKYQCRTILCNLGERERRETCEWEKFILLQ